VQHGRREIREEFVVVRAHGFAHAECLEDEEAIRDLDPGDRVQRGKEAEDAERAARVEQCSRETAPHTGCVAALQPGGAVGFERYEAQRGHLAARGEAAVEILGAAEGEACATENSADKGRAVGRN
jgi:hypothetical protein